MFKHSLFVIAIFLLAACAPSPTQLTSTANAVFAQTETAAPTATLTQSPTLTPTPTLTLTATPIPTLLGGGNGEILFSADAIYKVNSNGTGLKQILSPSQIESIVGSKYEDLIYSANHGQNYIITKKGFYVVKDDWQLIDKVELKYSEYIRSYLDLDFEHIVWNDGQHATGNEYFTNGKLGTQLLLGADARIIGWSADGKVIYFRKDNGKTTWSVNSDGSNKHKLNLDTLKNFTYSGIKEGDTFENPILDRVISNAYYRNIDWIAISPNQSKVVFTWVNLLLVADAKDLEFSDPHLITELPSSPNSLFWSPDGKTLLIQLSYCENNSCGEGDIILVETSSGEFRTVHSHKDYKWVGACGFSPDSKQVVLRFYNETYMIRLLDLDTNSTIDIQIYVGNCPLVWR